MTDPNRQPIEFELHQVIEVYAHICLSVIRLYSSNFA